MTKGEPKILIGFPKKTKNDPEMASLYAIKTKNGNIYINFNDYFNHYVMRLCAGLNIQEMPKKDKDIFADARTAHFQVMRDIRVKLDDLNYRTKIPEKLIDLEK
jgi:hypothetical protein